MGADSKIEWTTHTFNPWRGCTKVSEGCKYCYADTLSKRNPGTLGIWGLNGTRVVASKSMWQQPLKWDAASKAAGERHRVFCASLADVFEDWQGPISSHDGDQVFYCMTCRNTGLWPIFNNICPNCGVDCKPEPATMDHVRARLFAALIDATPNLDWLILTKRPENILKMWPIEFTGTREAIFPGMSGPLGIPLPTHARKKRNNVWLGTSVENQEQAEKRIPKLLKCRDLSPVLFLSCEPLLGPVDLKRFVPSPDGFTCPDLSSGPIHVDDGGAQVDWVIVGGESGPNARPMHPYWVRSLRDQCQAAEVPFLFKQWGEWQNGSSEKQNASVLNNGRMVYPDTAEGRKRLDAELGGDWNRLSPTAMAKVGKKASGRMLDGREWNEFPEVVQ